MGGTNSKRRRRVGGVDYGWGASKYPDKIGVICKENIPTLDPEICSGPFSDIFRGINTFKIVLLGPGGCGLTTCAKQFLLNQFIEEYDPTIEDSYRKQCEITLPSQSTHTFVLDILDTAGQEEYSAMRFQWIRSGTGFIVMYPITNRRGFEDVVKFMTDIERVKDQPIETIPLVLVGNKADIETEREISYEEGLELSRKYSCPFLETSAKTQQNIVEMFYGAAIQIALKTVQQRRHD